MSLGALNACTRTGSAATGTSRALDRWLIGVVRSPREQLSIPVDQDLLRGLLRGRFVVGAFDELAVLELRAGADQCHEMGCVDRPPA